MKYARLLYGKNENQLATAQYVNIGDYFQTFAIDNIYKIMQIPEEDIISIDRKRLTEYTGRLLRLPMQGWFGYIKGIEIFPLPQAVSPAFLGYHCITKKNYSAKCIHTYKQYEPICCRDETTYLFMRKHGINAYLTGCMTITLPERECEPEKIHVFLVDAPQGIEKYMPEELKEHITYITQEVQVISANDDKTELSRLENLSHELLKRYKKEATLVVTSRLHCAGPCLGMGIPVILARNYFDDRYAWIDKYLKLYTPDQFQNINWYPEKVDLSDIKPQLIKMADQIIRNDPHKEETIRQIHEFYMNRTRNKIHVPFYTKIYLQLHETFPQLADFIREVVLKRFTVATGRDKSEI